MSDPSDPSTPSTDAVNRMLERFRWKKVEAPRAWAPTIVGEELAGFYAGRTLRKGRYGQYEVVLVAVPGEGMRMISGTQIIQLVDAGQFTVGQPIRIAWYGYKELQGPEDKPRQMKLFEVFRVEMEAVTAEELLAVAPH